MKKSTFIIALLTTLFVTLFVAPRFASAQNKSNRQPPKAQDKDAPLRPTVRKAVKFDISPPLRTIKPNLSNDFTKGDDDRGGQPVNDMRYDPDPVVQQEMGEGVFSQERDIASGVSFNGMSNTQGFTPPDPNGDIGLNHYVQMVNSRFQIFSRTGTSVFGPANINTLFAGFGGACQNENAGDPVVLYDQIADRWLLSQFTAAGPTYFNCVAISTTPDPTGTYYRYAFMTGNSSTNFPDYPKYGVWSDAYYISTREFSAAGPFAGVGAYALNRAQMLAGNPSPTVVSFLLPPGSTPYRPGDGLLPSDVDGDVLPPAGSPNYFVGSMDQGGPYGAPADALNLFKFAVNFTTPANSTFTSVPTQIPIAAFDTIFSGCAGRACIPQPSTTNRLDILSYRQRPTFRLAYRNYGTHESLVTTQSVEATAALAGMRWWEIRNPNAATPTLFQEGTYAPNNIHRWMGSVAMDNDGNMALGYSVSNATVFPGVRYTGRLSTDPLGTMPQGEGVLVNGTGSQTGGGNRWGDYSSLNVDPFDDCTFWYTQEYYSVTSTSNWNTRIGSFKFPGCSRSTAAGVTVSGRVLAKRSRALTGVQRATVSITGNGGQTKTTLTDANGNFRFEEVASGETYIFSVSARGYQFEPQAINVTEDLEGITFIGR